MGGYLPTSRPGGPGSLPGNQCGFYGALCDIWADSSPIIWFYSCQYHFTNAPYFCVCHKMSESLNNTQKWTGHVVRVIKNTYILPLGDIERKVELETWENNIKMEFIMN
jgi:hypothetical protein